MASNQTITPAAQNAAVDAFAAALAGGKIKYYDGVQRANPSVPITTQVKLVEFILPDPLEVNVADDGTVQFANVTAVLPVAAGIASWFAAEKADGTPERDGTIGTADADLIVDTTTIALGKPVMLAGSIQQSATV